MSSNIHSKDIRTLGYVLKRTNYGEADRILNLITPQGKISAIAKSVRREKSKLAGNIEMFTLSDFNIHLGRGEFGIVTGAKMLKHYGEITKDLNKMELAVAILKRANKLAEGSDSPDYFKIVDQSLNAINRGEDSKLIEAWCLLNFKKIMGEEINLYRDSTGEKLSAEDKYIWDIHEMAFIKNDRGEYGANEIKLSRLMVSNDLNTVCRVKTQPDMVEQILRLAHTVI